MSIIHQKQTRLPDQRVKLYKEAVDILLRRWQQHKQGALTPSPALTRFLEDENRLRSSMYRLAYEAHCARCQDKKNQTADLPRGEALVILGDAKYIGDLNLAQEFLDYVDQRAGLLVVGYPFLEFAQRCQLPGARHRDHRSPAQVVLVVER